MTLPPSLCAIFHRAHWHFVARQETGPAMLTRQRHVGIYRCGICDTEHHVVGGPIHRSDAGLPLDATPPVRGLAMRLHKLLGGPT